MTPTVLPASDARPGGHAGDNAAVTEPTARRAGAPRPSHRTRLPRPAAGRRSRSPTGAAPPTPSWTAWRTRSPRSGTRLPRLRLPRDRRARHPRRRAAGLPRRRARPGHRHHRRHRRARRTPRCARPLVGGQEPIPTLAELLEALPDARFNVDLKSDAAVPAPGRPDRRAWSPRPGAGGLVLAAPAEPVPPAHRRPGRHLGRTAGGGRLPVPAVGPARRPRDPRPGRGAPGPPPARPAHGHQPGLVTARPRRR